MIIKNIISSFYDENIYIITDKITNESIIIDPGNSFKDIVKYINNNKFRPIAILNTHSHPDHIVAGYDLQQEYSIPLKMHKDEESIISHLSGMAQMIGLTDFNIPKNISFFDESLLNIGSFKISVLHTPGHSPGSACFLINNNLFSGDTLFAGSIGRVDLPGGSQTDMQNSLGKLVKLPPETQVFPGHGNKTTIGNEIKTNPFLLKTKF